MDELYYFYTVDYSEIFLTSYGAIKKPPIA